MDVLQIRLIFHLEYFDQDLAREVDWNHLEGCMKQSKKIMNFAQKISNFWDKNASTAEIVTQKTKSPNEIPNVLQFIRKQKLKLINKTHH